MRVLLILASIILIVAPVDADVITVTESWESWYWDFILGCYGMGNPPVLAWAVSDAPCEPVDGTQVLRLTYNALSGTPEAYVAWVRELLPGDTVEASLWRYDDTPDTLPSCYIWGHWNDDPYDVDARNGSAGGNGDCGPGTGWDQTSWTWTVPAESQHTGLVVEVRVSGHMGAMVWIDQMIVSAPSHADIQVPGNVSPVESSSWGRIKGSYR